MKVSKGQALIEFLLVFIVLLVAVSGIFFVYKKFWRMKYKKVSSLSAVTASVLKKSEVKFSYVK